MTKMQFILSLHDRLAGLPREDLEDRLSFYSEMIEDRMEEGLSEEEAVAALGSVDDIASQIVDCIPLSKIVKEKIKPKRRLKAWEIVLLIAGFPVWLPLLIAALAVIFALYCALWSVVASLWAVFASFSACAFAGIVAGAGFAIGVSAPIGLVLIGAGIFLAGCAIFTFFGCIKSTKYTALLAKKIVLGIKKIFVIKEAA